jgi:hypothetical protein
MRAPVRRGKQAEGSSGKLEPDAQSYPERWIELAPEQPVVVLGDVSTKVHLQPSPVVKVLGDAEARPRGRGDGIQAPAAGQPVLTLRLEQLDGKRGLRAPCG